jgi:hypothetical protein
VAIHPGSSPIWYGSCTTVAPAAFNVSNSPFTSGVSIFKSILPGCGFLPLTSLCGPTVIHPVPNCQPV